MNTRMNATSVCIGLVVTLIAVVPSARANLLVDPGFEANPLTNYANVLNNFAGFQGFWGVEAATITGVDGGVTPAQGVRMLRMVSDGLTTTQGFQTTNITSYAALVDSGGATVNLSGLFNAGPNVPAAVGGVYVFFCSAAANWGSQTGAPVGGVMTLDGSPSTWQTSSVSTGIPVGTRWLVTQVSYTNSTLLGNAGYVDAVDLTVVPEPASIGLAALGVLAIRRRVAGRSR